MSLNSFKPVTTWTRDYHYPHFTDEETEDQRREALLKVTELVSGRARIQIQAASVQRLNVSVIYFCPTMLYFFSAF